MSTKAALHRHLAALGYAMDDRVAWALPRGTVRTTTAAEAVEAWVLAARDLPAGEVEVARIKGERLPRPLSLTEALTGAASGVEVAALQETAAEWLLGDRRPGAEQIVYRLPKVRDDCSVVGADLSEWTPDDAAHKKLDVMWPQRKALYLAHAGECGIWKEAAR